MAGKLQDKVAIVTGAASGFGRGIAERFALEGARVVAADINGEGVRELAAGYGSNVVAVSCDVSKKADVDAMVRAATEAFGGLDIVVNNASALSLTDSQATDMKRFDLMHQINARGTFMTSKFAVPYLEKAANPHILMLSPPLDLREKWFAPNTAYAMAKYGMSLVVLGLAGELRGKRIAVNALWPRTTIATSAIKKFRGDAVMRASRTPDILADAAHAIFLKDAKTFTGNFLIDDTFLFANGVRDFDRYRVDPGVDLEPDFFVPDNPPPVSLKKAAG
jgi:citronellol/citronellal dehydrogenase